MNGLDVLQQLRRILSGGNVAALLGRCPTAAMRRNVQRNFIHQVKRRRVQS